MGSFPNYDQYSGLLGTRAQAEKIAIADAKRAEEAARAVAPEPKELDWDPERAWNATCDICEAE